MERAAGSYAVIKMKQFAVKAAALSYIIRARNMAVSKWISTCTTTAMNSY